MQPSDLFKGVIIGFSIAAPLGPIGVLCIKRTLSSGRRFGLLSGIGAATVDAFYSSVAAFGLTFISNFLLEQQIGLRLTGGAFLIFLGLRTIFSKPKDMAGAVNPGSFLNAYGSTFLLTLTNPLTILSFAAIFTGLGLIRSDNSFSSAGIMVLGVFLGSLCWWFILTEVTNLFKTRMNQSRMTWVNRISGTIILGFGIAAITGALVC